MDARVTFSTNPIDARRRGVHSSRTEAQNGAALDVILDEITDMGGGSVVFPPGIIPLDRPVAANVPLHLAGAIGGRAAALPGTELRFAAGVDGINLGFDARNSLVEDLRIISLGGSAGHGVQSRSTRSTYRNLHIENFPEHGLYLDTEMRTATSITLDGTIATVTMAGHGYLVGEQIVLGGMTPTQYNSGVASGSTAGVALILSVPTADTFTYDTGYSGFASPATVIGTIYAGNDNVSLVEGVRCQLNDGDGFRIAGADSNVVTLIACDGSGNGGYGFNITSARNAVLGCHASGNAATVATTKAAVVPTGYSWSAGVVTVTAASHGLAVGQSVTVAGVTPSGYNGTYTIRAAGYTTNAFTYAKSADPGGVGTVFGTVVEATMTADFRDAGGSSLWLNPYSEGSKAFVIDGSAAYGRYISAGVYAEPTIWSGLAGSTMRQNATKAIEGGWDIKDSNGNRAQSLIRDETTGKQFRLDVGMSLSGFLALRNVSDGVILALINLDGTRWNFPANVATSFKPGAGGSLSWGQATGDLVGMHGSFVAKETVTGSRGGNAALADLLTKLASKGIITDGSSA